MLNTTEAYDARGRTLLDESGEKIGRIDELYHDQEGGQAITGGPVSEEHEVSEEIRKEQIGVDHARGR